MPSADSTVLTDELYMPFSRRDSSSLRWRSAIGRDFRVRSRPWSGIGMEDGRRLVGGIGCSCRRHRAQTIGWQKAKKSPAKPHAVGKAAGQAAPDALLEGLVETPVTQGSQPLENPSDGIAFYGYHDDGPMLPAPGAVQSPGNNVEASKTEPDKNTYLVLRGQTGPDPDDDYGTHFLFRGTSSEPRAMSRGSTWTPTTCTASRSGPRPTRMDLRCRLRRLDMGSVREAAPFHGGARRQRRGLVVDARVSPVVEDCRGSSAAAATKESRTTRTEISGSSRTSAAAMEPSTLTPASRTASSIASCRRIPTTLERGPAQVLRVYSLATGQPIVFHAGQADADILSADIHDLFTYGKHFATLWVTIHDTDSDGTTSFDADALARATRRRRSNAENGLFRPGSRFREFVFDEHGRYQRATEAGSAFGGFGGIFRLFQTSPSADQGVLTLLYRGDLAHTGLDNCGFWDRNRVVFVEDAGDGLHASRNAFDSAYLFDLRVDYSNPNNQPVRLVALGRDASATVDSGIGAIPNRGFQNEGDNEITGFHVSDGDPGADGILGAKTPRALHDGWRVFYTQQHGDNVTWEILAGDDASPHFPAFD